MTQEDKELLLKDLCARLPYGVKCVFHSKDGDIPSTVVKIDTENKTVSHKPNGQNQIYFHWIESGNIKPYLRPMSNMTADERKYYNYLTRLVQDGEAWEHEVVDWLNTHHFDYRGLIEKGLAFEAPEEMYKTE